MHIYVHLHMYVYICILGISNAYKQLQIKTHLFIFFNNLIIFFDLILLIKYNYV